MQILSKYEVSDNLETIVIFTSLAEIRPEEATLTL